jgi:hypothetical protein
MKKGRFFDHRMVVNSLPFSGSKVVLSAVGASPAFSGDFQVERELAG